MTASDPPDSDPPHSDSPDIDPSDDVTPTSKGAVGPATRNARKSDVAADGSAIDEETLARIVNAPRDVGWMMVTVGVLGVILPGIVGTPFLVAGIAVLVPDGPQRLTHWVRRNPNWVVHTGLKQMGRWLDDLERRYPRPHSS
jgi:hypothetical protein